MWVPCTVDQVKSLKQSAGSMLMPAVFRELDGEENLPGCYRGRTLYKMFWVGLKHEYRRN